MKLTAEELKKFWVKRTVTLYTRAWGISGRRDLRGFPLLLNYLLFNSSTICPSIGFSLLKAVTELGSFSSVLSHVNCLINGAF